MYKLTMFPDSILRIADTAYIRVADDNPDYQAYLEWVAEGNVPAPADLPKQADLAATAKTEALPLRQKALDVLSGLAVDSLVKGDIPAAAMCSAARDKIKDMGTLDLSACTTYHDMQLAYKQAWANISTTFADYPDLRNAFNKALK